MSNPNDIAAKARKRQSSTKGLAPGTLVHVGHQYQDHVRYWMFNYNEEQYQEELLKAADKVRDTIKEGTVTWLNIDGLHDIEQMEKVQKLFDLHPLLMEDILNTEQRPKMEVFANCVFLTFKMMTLKENGRLHVEQISLVLGHHFVLSFQEHDGDTFERPIRIRIRKSIGKIRQRGNDYLMYLLADAVTDRYFEVIEQISERIDNLEDRILKQDEEGVIEEMRVLKRSLLSMRRMVVPLKEALGTLEKTDTALLGELTRQFIRDVYDHASQIIDSLDLNREILNNAMEIHWYNVSEKGNQVMKVLTIIATIFIPLTFIAGIYGMNFEYMPELQWKYGYFAVWGVMLMVAVVMFIYFRRKKWW